jgi:4-hydroxybenzoate polyprenyltransferase
MQMNHFNFKQPVTIRRLKYLFVHNFTLAQGVETNHLESSLMPASAYPSSSIARFSNQVRAYADLVQFEHTIFALPFALSSMLLAVSPHTWPSWITCLCVVLAMVGGRTYAMGLNRLIDARIDAKNPRTANRSIPAGRMSTQKALGMVIVAALLFIGATLPLPIICLQLVPVAFAILTIYSYVKLFSPLAHLVLGLALGSSAVGGWLAVTGHLTILPVLFGLAVAFWVGGFDIIYACQDYSFDRESGLHSIPVALGLEKALWVSRIFHTLTIALLSAFAYLYPYTGWGFKLAILLTAGMLLYEHGLVRGDKNNPIRLEKVNAAFFTINGRISIAVFVLVLMDKLIAFYR